MSKSKRIKKIIVEYYQVCSYIDVSQKKNTSTLGDFDITLLLEELQKAEVQKRLINYNGENLILSNIKHNEDSGLWELVFFRSRSSSIPYIVDSNGKPREIFLKNNEALSEVLCVEYDSTLKVLAMQRNIHACNSRGIEEFFSNFIKNKKISLVSMTMLNEDKKSYFKKAVLKKFHLRVKFSKKKKGNEAANSFPFLKKDTSICNAIDSAIAVNSSIINVEFSTGNSSSSIKLKDEDFEAFTELMDSTDVKSLELGFAPDEKSTMQITDFVDLRVRDYIYVTFIKGKPLDIKEILNMMTENFKKNPYIR